MLGKIDAIKAYRDTYGTGLKESKEAVELVMKHLSPDVPEGCQYAFMQAGKFYGPYQAKWIAIDAGKAGKQNFILFPYKPEMFDIIVSWEVHQ